MTKTKQPSKQRIYLSLRMGPDVEQALQVLRNHLADLNMSAMASTVSRAQLARIAIIEYARTLGDSK